MYVLYFALGAYAWRGQWFSFLVMSVVYVLFRLGVFGAFMPLETIVVHAVLHNLFCLTAVMALVAWFQAYVAFASPLWRQSAALSYPVYYVHQSICCTAFGLAIPGYWLAIRYKIYSCLHLSLRDFLVV